MKKAATVLMLLCVTLLSCAVEPCGNTVRYEVNGAALGPVTINIINEFGYAERYTAERLPWKTRFKVKERGDEYFGGNFTDGKYTAYVSAITNNYSGHVTVAIYLNGKLVQTGETTINNRQAEAYYLIHL